MLQIVKGEPAAGDREEVGKEMKRGIQKGCMVGVRREA